MNVIDMIYVKSERKISFTFHIGLKFDHSPIVIKD